MPDSPKLAVVVSCYNYGSFVERAIRSVRDQGRDDCELVVVDDGSFGRAHAKVPAISRPNVIARARFVPIRGVSSWR